MFFNTVTLWNKDKMIFKIFDIIELIEVYELRYALKFFVLVSVLHHIQKLKILFKSIILWQSGFA